ncbi:hypothetical protein OS242_10430 [Tumebacillus sp. DT12]|uniref:Uncharacterized protein n=1 Tax=Tumebacillus lacus TaxID=2995335 RepID=A0ABT3X0E7_9BACL|nr:hypothetical protein [Tumebacillus lacus]MCX7570380.1 hypothetical protein [Tumebacillus lacus]
MKVKLLTYHGCQWWRNKKGLQGVLIDITYEIIEITKEARPQLNLQVIKGGKDETS